MRQGAHGGGSKTKTKPDLWVYSLMGRPGIINGSWRIFVFNLKINLIILFILYEIQQTPE